MSVLESHVQTIGNIAAFGFGLCLLITGAVLLIATY